MDIYDACKLLHIICKYTGTAPYSLQQSELQRHYEFTEVDKIINDIIALAIVILSFVGFYYLILFVIDEDTVKYISYHMLNCIYIANTLLSLYISRFYGRNLTINVFNQINDIDHSFAILTTKRVDYEKYGKVVLKFVLMKYFTTFISITGDVWIQFQLLYGTCMYQISAFINANRCCLISIMLLIIKEKMKIMHHYLRNFDVLQEKRTIVKKLRRAVKLHTIILEVSLRAHKMFKLEMLLRILSCFFYSTFSLYVYDYDNFISFVIGQLWAITYVAEFVILVYSYESLETTAINDIDHTFATLTAQRADYKKSRKIILTFVLVKYFTTLMSILGDVLINLELIYGTFMYQISAFLNANRCCLNSIMLLNIKDKMKIMHHFLRNFDLLQEKQTIVIQLKKVLKLHTIIIEVALRIQKIFKMEMLLRILTCFFYSTFSLYDYDYDDVLSFVIGQLWAITYIAEFVVLVYSYSSVETTAKKTVQLMEDLERAVGKSNLPYKQVELFSLQVYVEDFKFSVFGCFPLDWTLLHSMVAGVATYLVIFHQFSNMEKKV
ncbi:hypothetical protein FQR65_LT09230 [Abscondita terminalis]|nr:hypothetical protein FQR65_LT09230 [Abscondita terminalis]